MEIAAAGATAATAEAKAARRANSRREMPPGLAGLSLEFSSIKISVCPSLFVSGAAGSRLWLAERRLLKAGVSVNNMGRSVKAKRQGGELAAVAPTPGRMRVNTKELRKKQFVRI